MTVEELINKLQLIENKQLPVVIRYTDPTDWDYVTPINECPINEEEIPKFDEGGCDIFPGIGDEEHDVKCLVITFVEGYSSEED